MAIHAETIEVRTSGRGFTEITGEVDRFVRGAGAELGFVNVFLKHTSASLIVNENADPDVRVDLERFLSDLVPDGDPRYVHDAEGPDDMPAHVRNVLTMTSITLPVRGGRLALGTWQGIYLWEHRRRGHLRALELTLSH